MEPKIGRSITDEKGIKCALFHFSNLDKEERIALYQLRNSLAHNFSLATEKNKHPHKFIISIDESDRVVEKSRAKWDAGYNKKIDDTSTTIFLRNLIELIEEIFSKVRKMAEEENLTLILEDGVDELFARYSII